jgi:hypothetical protein
MKPKKEFFAVMLIMANEHTTASEFSKRLLDDRV